MHRSVVRILSLAVLLGAAAAQDLAAQADAGARPRWIVAPQVGGVVSHSRGAEVNAAASVIVEMPVGRGWSVSAEWTRPYGGFAERACPFVDASCAIGAELRSAGAVGVMARPFRVGPFAPYAGVSGGVVRWTRSFHESGVAPLTALRAGVDVRVVGPVGLRADVVRRVAWTDAPTGSPLRADMFSLGARIDIRR